MVLGTTDHCLGGGNSLTYEDGIGRLSGSLHTPVQLPDTDIVPAPSPGLEGGCSCKSSGSALLGHRASRGLCRHLHPPAVPAKECLCPLHLLATGVPGACLWLSPQRFSSEPSAHVSAKSQASSVAMQPPLSQATSSAVQGPAPAWFSSVVKGFSDGETPQDGEWW